MIKGMAKVVCLFVGLLVCLRLEFEMLNSKVENLESGVANVDSVVFVIVDLIRHVSAEDLIRHVSADASLGVRSVFLSCFQKSDLSLTPPDGADGVNGASSGFAPTHVLPPAAYPPASPATPLGTSCSEPAACRSCPEATGDAAPAVPAAGWSAPAGTASASC